jgi:DNA-binding HxlR family transcriptional regulator
MSKKAISCPLEKTLEIIGGRWKVLIIRELAFKGTVRFGELHRSLVGISQRILTKELRELERQKILRRKVYREIPPKVEYSLTQTGQTLDPVLKAMSEWGKLFIETNL